MPTNTKSKSKGARQQAVRRARVAAAAQAARRHDRHRWWIAFGGVAVLLIAIVLGAFVSKRGSSSKTATASGPAVNCVEQTDTSPPGAPYVPVHVGPAPTELVVELLRPGTGTEPVKPGDSVTVNYVGVNCRDGKIFDSSWSQGHPASFQLGEVIPGWQQGIPGMHVGEERLLGIPPNLAYGPDGRPGIEPNATLWFVVDLLSIGAHPSTSATTAPGESIPPAPTSTPPPVSS
jgi:peptidylprolyl isomerase